MVIIQFEQGQNRSAAYQGVKEVGECVFSPSCDAWTITHTYVDPAFSGQGIAAKLVDEVVRQARNRRLRIVAQCPYAKKHLQKP